MNNNISQFVRLNINFIIMNILRLGFFSLSSSSSFRLAINRDVSDSIIVRCLMLDFYLTYTAKLDGNIAEN